MDRIAGKVMLLTGASRGIGPVIAEHLAQKGATLALTARSQDGLRETEKIVAKHGCKALVVPTDLRQAAAREALIATVMSAFDRIDVLINNAGVESEGAYEELPWERVAETIEVNLTAPMHLVHMVLPGMLRRRSGHIVNIASLAAKAGLPYGATYSATKAGLAEWTKSLRLELAGAGVVLSTIFPGYIRERGMFAKFGLAAPWLLGSCRPEQVAEAVVAAIETGRRERIVNSMPVRHAFLFGELSAGLGEWIYRTSGMVAFQKRKVGT